MIFSGCTSPSSDRATSPLTTVDNVQVVDTSILASLSNRHRITKGGVKLIQLKIVERKQFYHEAAQ